jgi:hypothetical protein
LDIRDVKVDVLGLIDGKYNISIYDPSNGEYISKSTGDSTGGKLNLNFPEIKKDLAVRITKI